MHPTTESLRPLARSAPHPVALTLDATADALSVTAHPTPVVPAPAAPARELPVRGARARALQRAACRWFHVAGAQVDVQRVLFGVLPWFRSERCDVEDLSKGGVIFECRFPMVPRESIDLELRVPGERGPLALKGAVRWCKRARYGGYRIGVQLAPYGAGPDQNPRSALDALRAIEAKHA